MLRAVRDVRPAWLPAILIAGPLFLLARLDVVANGAADAGMWIAFGLGAAWLVLRVCVTGLVVFVNELRQVVHLPPLLFGVLCWELAAVGVFMIFQRPTPSPGFFATAAQVDATLLVATALVVDVPPAWRATPLAWLASGLVVTGVGLFGALWGALGKGDPQLLFVLAISPVVPCIVAFLVAAHARFERSADTTTTEDRTAGDV